MSDLAIFQKTIGVSFRDISLLETALLHTSYVNENLIIARDSNERLEFLGDAVLGCVVAEKLYQDFPELAEGEMTKIRSALVRRDTLARVAKMIKLGDYLYLGKGEEATGGRNKLANLSCALEAVIAAVYLDRGLEVARDCILQLLSDAFSTVSIRNLGIDYKSQLQELIQSRQQLAPTYRTIRVIGPDHDQTFTVEVLASGAVLGKGSGKSKKLAETDAARVALEQLYR